jgi:hypothetical protein
MPVYFLIHYFIQEFLGIVALILHFKFAIDNKSRPVSNDEEGHQPSNRRRSTFVNAKT